MAALGAEGRRFKSCLPDQFLRVSGDNSAPLNGNERRTPPPSGAKSHGIVPDKYRDGILESLCKATKARFWDKVDVRGPDECWHWTASLTTSGYGRFKLTPYRQASSNRVALVIATGEEHDHLMALHSCDRPSCCNPAHLRWGTARDNSDDKVSRARCRNGSLSGFDNPRCTLTREQLVEIVALIDAGKLTNGAIAGRFGLHHSMISKIRTGNSWQREVAAIRDASRSPSPGRNRND